MHDERMRTRVPADGDWRQRGACRDHDPELFFPDGDEPLARVQAGTAKAICRTCPVAGTCLAWALSTRQSYGVWGGLTQDERRAVLAVRAVAARFAPTGRAVTGQPATNTPRSTNVTRTAAPTRRPAGRRHANAVTRAVAGQQVTA